MSDGREALLRIEDLSVAFPSAGGETRVLDRVSLSVEAGEVFGVIGQTGAGKSMTAAAAIGLIPPPGRVTGGRVLFDGRDLLGMDDEQLRRLRGKDVATIVQNPRAALNPVVPVGRQIANVYRAHNQGGARQAEGIALDALASVGLPSPNRLARAYAHQLSGGMAQRVLIAMALVNAPRLVLADEPTTGLDVTIQAEILDLMTGLVRERGTAVMLITHDLGVIANYCDRGAVMLAGQVVEIAPTRELFTEPRHPYTRGLIDAFALDSLGERPRSEGLPRVLSYGHPPCPPAARPSPGEAGGGGEESVLAEVREGHWVRCATRRAAGALPRSPGAPSAASRQDAVASRWDAVVRSLGGGRSC
jgi:ABC-type dipeptide/oligopeptide/nickel transport system ATPase component